MFSFILGRKRIKPDNEHIRIIGRAEKLANKKIRFDWPGIEFAINFTGTYCAIYLEDKGNDYHVVVDGMEMPRVVTKHGKRKYVLAKKLKKSPHTVIVTKRTETYDGIGVFNGFQISGVINEPPRMPKKKIEFIGDSLTVGFGIEGPCIDCPSDTERQYKNNYMSYAQVASRALDASCHIIAVSGRGMVKNYGETTGRSIENMPYLYDRVICTKSEPKWNFIKFVPDAVVINLGTNDFSAEPKADEKEFINSYLDLIKRVRFNYEKAAIFLVSGPVIGEILHPIVDKIAEMACDVNLHRVKLSPVPESDMGCQWHPNVSANKKMAAELVVAMMRSGF